MISPPRSPKTSALVLVAEQPTIGDFASAVARFGGKVIETNLNEGDIKALRKAFKKACRDVHPRSITDGFFLRTGRA